MKITWKLSILDQKTVHQTLNGQILFNNGLILQILSSAESAQHVQLMGKITTPLLLISTNFLGHLAPFSANLSPN